MTIVRGGYVNDPGCTIPTALSPVGPTTFAFSCWGHGALWAGGFTGHTIARIDATFDVNGNLQGTYDDWFYGRYMGDGTFGVLHFRGTFSVNNASQEFYAEATIVGGTCGFAGSSGSYTADGNPFTGGFTAYWIRPKNPPPSEPACNPLDPESLRPTG